MDTGQMAILGICGIVMMVALMAIAFYALRKSPR